MSHPPQKCALGESCRHRPRSRTFSWCSSKSRWTHFPVRLHAVGGLAGDAFPHAGRENLEAGPVQCPRYRGELGDDVLAVASLLDHGDDAGELSLGAAQPLQQENAGARIMTKVQPPPALGGRFATDRFAIDLATGTVACPGHVIVAIRPATGGGGVAAFGAACAGCPLAGQCTTSPTGRTVTLGAYE
jgi:hypothetical protein